MGEGILPPRRIDTIAYRLRNWPAIHRLGRWFRRTLWSSLVEGFWEFARHFFAKNPRFGPPLKTFSVYRALRCGWPKMNGRIVLHDQGVPKVTGDSLLVKSGLTQHVEQPWPILWSEHANARLVSESLALLLPGKALCIESAYNEGRWRSDPASRYLRLPPPTRLAGNWTSIVSKWVPNLGLSNYGHWLVDALPRLALLSEFPPDTRIIVPPDLRPYQKESLELLGVWDRCRPTPEAHLEIEHYFFSSPVGMIACYNPYMINFLRKTLLPKKDPKYSGPRKFFMQRTTRRRPVENIEEIADFFRRKGWAVVKDMDFTLAETIKLFSEAEAFCSNQGSNVTNVLFCPPGCTVMHLVPDSNMDGWIDWIAEVCRLNYHFSVVPCGGPDTTKIVIDIKQIEEFFASAGVSF
ncbi:MAG: glycosyltransferase family 61 protein [Verrucomicrobiia bacterium]